MRGDGDMLDEKYVTDTLRNHGETLRNHTSEINQLKTNDAVRGAYFETLSKSVDKLTNVIIWFGGVIIAGFIGMIYTYINR